MVGRIKILKALLYKLSFFFSINWIFPRYSRLLAYKLKSFLSYINYKANKNDFLLTLCSTLAPFLSYIGGPEDHPQIWLFPERIQHIVVLMPLIYYNKRMQSKIGKEKGHMGWSLEESKHKLLRVLSQWSLNRCFYLPQQILTTFVKYCLPRKLSSKECPRLSLGAGHLDTLCLKCTKTVDSQKRSRCSA